MQASANVDDISQPGESKDILQTISRSRELRATTLATIKEMIRTATS